LVAALAAASITTPSAIQVATIPDVLAGSDVSGEAPTGSGKTLAFGVPMLQRIAVLRAERNRRSSAAPPLALVVAPTRELARQILRTLEPLAAAVDLRLLAVHGGVPFEPQIEALATGIDILIACPGRLLDLHEQGYVQLGHTSVVVIDEADHLADMGFLPDVTALLALTSAERQTLLFSATLGGEVADLIDVAQRSPIRHDIAAPDMVPVRHHLWSVEADDRVGLLADIAEHCGPTVAFSNTRRGAEHIVDQLRRRGVTASLLHGGNAQDHRTLALDRFATGAARLLVATDVAARGLHVDGVACVVHVDLPTDPTDYVHRSGRTGRAGAVGTVVAFVDPAATDAARRFISRVAADPAGDIVGEVEITRPDVYALESAAERRAIDREIAAIEHLVRPGAVGAVKFSRPG
jgi:superfamily II DNA/RNA helicase